MAGWTATNSIPTRPAPEPKGEVYAAPRANPQIADSGVVEKVPSFYAFYTGPRRPELNAVGAMPGGW